MRLTKTMYFEAISYYTLGFHVKTKFNQKVTTIFLFLSDC
jgi:hypothetical protein